MGLFIAGGELDVLPGPRSSSCSIALVLLTAAAFLGNVVGYEIGRAIGPPLYQRDGRILKRKYFDQTRRLLRQARQQGAGDRPVRAVRAHLHHGRRRRDPDAPAAVLRSGASSAPCCGCVSITLLGFFLGAAFPTLGENIDKAIIVILAFSVIPIAWEWWRHKRTAAPEAEDRDHDGRPDRDILGQDVD